MLGTVSIEQLEIPCVIGIYPHERNSIQSIFVNLTVDCDISRCVQTDSLHEALDYDKLANLCTQIAQKGRYKLLESYAHAVVEAIMNAFDVQRVKIKVSKPLALPKAKHAAVEIERRK